MRRSVCTQNNRARTPRLVAHWIPTVTGVSSARTVPQLFRVQNQLVHLLPEASMQARRVIDRKEYTAVGYSDYDSTEPLSMPCRIPLGC